MRGGEARLIKDLDKQIFFKKIATPPPFPVHEHSCFFFNFIYDYRTLVYRVTEVYIETRFMCKGGVYIERDAMYMVGLI